MGINMWMYRYNKSKVGLDFNKASEMMYLTACFPAQYYKHAELVRSHILVIRLSCSSFAVVVVISLSMQVTWVIKKMLRHLLVWACTHKTVIFKWIFVSVYSYVVMIIWNTWIQKTIMLIEDKTKDNSIKVSHTQKKRRKTALSHPFLTPHPHWRPLRV